MSRDRQPRIFIDHYLQGALLAKLAASDKPLRFSELKDDGIENSLFMYHANKLIARNVIEKTEDGFHLTPEGARLINAMAPGMWYAKPTPRPLVQFVITTGDMLLLSSRKGQLKALLNDYMLPGGLHKLGLSADENAVRISDDWFGKSVFTCEFLAVVESITTYGDGFTHHSLSHIFKGELKQELLPLSDDRFEFQWVPISDIRLDNKQFEKSQFVPLFIEKMRAGTLSQREVIRVDNI